MQSARAADPLSRSVSPAGVAGEADMDAEMPCTAWSATVTDAEGADVAGAHAWWTPEVPLAPATSPCMPTMPSTTRASSQFLVCTGPSLGATPGGMEAPGGHRAYVRANATMSSSNSRTIASVSVGRMAASVCR